MDKEEAHLLNEISNSVGKKVDDVDVGTVDVLNHEANSEKDELDDAFSDVEDLVSLKLLVLFNCFKQKLLYCPLCHN